MTLTELKDAREEGAGAHRRWFVGDGLELVVWEDQDGVRSYQLLYRDRRGDGVFEWRRDGALHHYGLDDGEGRAARLNASPVLRPGGGGAGVEAVLERFAAQGEGLEEALRKHVEQTLRPPAD